METFHIYALVDPETSAVRYVGRTSNPKKRLAAHLRSYLKKTTLVAKWISELHDRGLEPRMVVLRSYTIDKPAVTSWPNPIREEQEWISVFHRHGARLLNHQSAKFDK